MAVTPERIKGRLKIFTQANLSSKRIDAIADRLSKIPEDNAEDAKLDEVIKQFDTYNPLDEIAKEDDRVRLLESKANTPPKQDPPKPTDPPKVEVPKTEDVPAYVKELLDANKNLLEKVTAIESGKVLEGKVNSAKSEFLKSETFKGLKPDLQDFYFKNIDVNSETPIEDQVKTVEGIYKDVIQSHADSNGYSTIPQNGTANLKPNEDVVNSIVDGMK